eukprot:INCI9553.2.p1 GENE.INCI9553.2~~INCI9553.2.p1  ORF type:complete len:1319 (-),score=288.33 INCI9553.2:820-4776(-)
MMEPEGATQYVVQYFRKQELLAQQEYEHRQRLREKLVGKTTTDNVREGDQVRREELLQQVLRDCEEQSKQKLSQAWTQEKEFKKALSILQHNLHGVDTAEMPVRRNPLQVKWHSRKPVPHEKLWGASRPATSSSSSTSAASAVARPGSIAAVGNGRAGAHSRGSSESKQQRRLLQQRQQAQQHGAANAEYSLHDFSDGHEHDDLECDEAKTGPSGHGTPQTDSKKHRGRKKSKSRKAAAGADNDKPWRAAWSKKKIHQLEAKHRKKRVVKKRRVARVLRGKHPSGQSHATRLLESEGGTKRKQTPKLENYPTYGPQNLASRALRKFKGRTLNVDTVHQFTVSRATEHMREMHQQRDAERRKEEQKQREIQARLRDLDDRAKRTVSRGRADPQNQGGRLGASRPPPGGFKDVTRPQLIAECRRLFCEYEGAYALKESGGGSDATSKSAGSSRTSDANTRTVEELSWEDCQILLNDLGVRLSSPSPQEADKQAAQDGQKQLDEEDEDDAAFAAALEAVVFGDSQEGARKSPTVSSANNDARSGKGPRIPLSTLVEFVDIGRVAGLGTAHTKRHSVAQDTKSEVSSVAKNTLLAHTSNDAARTAFQEVQVRIRIASAAAGHSGGNHNSTGFTTRQSRKASPTKVTAAGRNKGVRESYKAPPLTPAEKKQRRMERQQRAREEAQRQEEDMKKARAAEERAKRELKTRERRLKQVEREKQRRAEKEREENERKLVRMQELRLKSQVGAEQAAQRNRERSEGLREQRKAQNTRWAKAAEQRNQERVQRLAARAALTKQLKEEMAAARAAEAQAEATGRAPNRQLVRLLRESVQTMRDHDEDRKTDQDLDDDVAMLESLQDAVAHSSNSEVREAAQAAAEALALAMDSQSSSNTGAVGGALRTDQSPLLERHEIEAILRSLFGDVDDAVGPTVFTEGGARELGLLLDHLALSSDAAALETAVALLDNAVPASAEGHGSTEAVAKSGGGNVEASPREPTIRLDHFLARLPADTVARLRWRGPLPEYFHDAAVRIQAPIRAYKAKMRAARRRAYTNACRKSVNSSSTLPTSLGEGQFTCEEARSVLRLYLGGKSLALSGENTSRELTTIATAQDGPVAAGVDSRRKVSWDNSNGGASDEDGMEALARAIGVAASSDTDHTRRRNRNQVTAKRRVRKSSLAQRSVSKDDGDQISKTSASPALDQPGSDIMAHSTELLSTHQLSNGGSRLDSLLDWLGIGFVGSGRTSAGASTDEAVSATSMGGVSMRAAALQAAAVVLEDASLASADLGQPEAVNLHWFLMLLPPAYCEKLRSSGLLLPGKTTAVTDL